VTVSLVVNVAGVDPITVVAEVASGDQLDPDSTPHNDLEIEDDQDSVSVTLSDEIGLGAPSRSDLIGLGTTSLPAQEIPTLSSEAGWLYWLYALIMGIVFIIMGLQLVRRS
jgi:hypothetical protein